MKCDDALKYIYLAGEMELNPEENGELAEHLKGCVNCQNEYSKAGNYFNLISNLQKKEIQIENYESVADNVMDRIHLLPINSNSTSGIFNWDIFYFAVFRYAAAVTLLLIGLFYFSEELTSFQKIRALEKKYELASENRFGETRYATVSPSLLKPVTDIYGFIHNERDFIELPGDWLLIKESEILRRIKEFKNSSGVNYENELKRFFSNPKVLKLMNNNEEIKNLFIRVFPEGVGNHE